MPDKLDSGLRDRPVLSIADAHRRAQGLLAEVDAGREVGYPELVDDIFGLAFSSVTFATQGEMTDKCADIWDRILVKSSKVKP